MYESYDELKKRCDELEKHLKDKEEECSYYKKIVEKYSNNSLEEIDEISTLVSNFRKTEEALHESEERYKQLFNHAPAGIFEIDLINNRFINANNVICDYCGYTKEELLALNPLEVLAEDSKSKFTRLVAKILAGEKSPNSFEYKMKVKTGFEFWALFNLKIVMEKGEPKGISAVIHNITDRKQAEEALKESEKKYRYVVENINIGIIVIQESKLVFVNTAMSRLLGYTKDVLFFHPDPIHFVHPDDRKLVAGYYDERLRTGQNSLNFRYRILTKDGDIKWLEETGVKILWKGNPAELIFLTDISNKVQIEEKNKKLEADIRHSQKMDALGILAGGVAHDFNNIITGIMGYADVLRLKLSNEPKSIKNLDEIIKLCQRAKELVAQILTFTRQKDQIHKSVNIGLIVKEALNMLRASLPTTIKIHKRIDANLGYIVADPTQIHQVLVNLAMNAAYAMEETGGILEITLSNEDIVDPNNKYDLSPGPYVLLTVKDSGHGIEEAILDRIFDPFFTTKPMGKGTGMGLAVVHGIVISHKGIINVESVKEKGTTFNVFFPRIKGSRREEKSKNIQIYPMGSERILFIDDETDITKVYNEILTNLGYKVEICNSSIEALHIFLNNPNEFDIIITDMTMPNMTGDALAKEILSIYPDVPIILCTGYSSKMTKQKASEMGIKEFLIKPIQLKELAQTIRNLLDAKVNDPTKNHCALQDQNISNNP
ncbi:MAG: PAS domain S-box protein [Desulfobacterales bacterium]|nr:PAS domain S-box protein [Desulfobacterales bacterium]